MKFVNLAVLAAVNFGAATALAAGPAPVRAPVAKPGVTAKGSVTAPTANVPAISTIGPIGGATAGGGAHAETQYTDASSFESAVGNTNVEGVTSEVEQDLTALSDVVEIQNLEAAKDDLAKRVDTVEPIAEVIEEARNDVWDNGALIGLEDTINATIRAADQTSEKDALSTVLPLGISATGRSPEAVGNACPALASTLAG